jgi:hypothetical protein
LFKLGRKGIINFIEAITVIVVIFIAFAVFFPGLSFKSKWPDAATILAARDSILTMDRLGILYQNSFDSSSLQNFIQTALLATRTNLIAVSEADGTIKTITSVVCNCSDEQIQNLNYWMSGMTINGRPANIIFFKTNLENINLVNVGGTNVMPDVLLIWGNTNLDSSAITASLLNYLKTGGGIIEINDFTSSSQTQPGGVQQTIFGITLSSTDKNIHSRAFEDHFSRKPADSSDIIYGAYKYFFHIPAPVKTYEEVVSSFPVEGLSQSGCTFPAPHGNFTLNNTAYNFWICNSNTVYFDTDNSQAADTIVTPGGNFNILGYNLTLRYINNPSSIGISFGTNYQFQDFLLSTTSPGGSCPNGNAWGQSYTNQIDTVENSPYRIILNASFQQKNLDLPVVIGNDTGGRTVWMSDFTNVLNDNCNGYMQIGDDQKLLLASLIFWSSNKNPSSSLSQTGIMIPYVNVQNSDMYDAYVFNLGLKSAFGS